MCDKVPVQDRLSEILAETMWCLAGSEESDEYAGRLYLEMKDNGSEEEDGVIDNDIERYMEEEMESDDDEDEGYKIISVEGLEDESEEETTDDEENQRHCSGAHLVAMYVATFFRTVRREWGNVDKHRVDKFYTAVRLMLREVRFIC